MVLVPLAKRNYPNIIYTRYPSNLLRLIPYILNSLIFISASIPYTLYLTCLVEVVYYFKVNRLPYPSIPSCLASYTTRNSIVIDLFIGLNY